MYEALALIAALVIGFFIGIFIRSLKKPKPIVSDGVLELFPTEDSLVIGVDLQTSAEVIEQKSYATFRIRKIAVNT